MESPAGSALKSPVLMLVIVAAFPAPMLWQLTRARKSGKGLVPCNAGGTGAWLARTSPRTRTSRCPSRLREPVPAVSIQGNPPPATPRTGLAVPTNGPVTGVIVENFSTVAGPGPAEAATPCTATALTRAAPPTAASSQLILRISHLLAGHQAAAVPPGAFPPTRSHVPKAPKVQSGRREIAMPTPGDVPGHRMDPDVHRVEMAIGGTQAGMPWGGGKPPPGAGSLGWPEKGRGGGGRVWAGVGGWSV